MLFRNVNFGRIFFGRQNEAIQISLLYDTQIPLFNEVLSITKLHIHLSAYCPFNLSILSLQSIWP